MCGNSQETKWAVSVLIKGTVTPGEETRGLDSLERKYVWLWQGGGDLRVLRDKLWIGDLLEKLW